MISPQFRWAENKQRECGGSIESHLAEYTLLHERLDKILEEKDLMKDVPTPYRTDVTKVRHCKTIDEAGFIKEFPQSARGYGLESVMGFYDIISKPEFIEWAAAMMGINKDKILELHARIESKLGKEYVSISKEIKKYR